jgi:hypothetical protein
MASGEFAKCMKQASGFLICFSDAVINSLKIRLSPVDFEKFIETVNELLRQEGVNYIGMVHFPFCSCISISILSLYLSVSLSLSIFLSLPTGLVGQQHHSVGGIRNFFLFCLPNHLLRNWMLDLFESNGHGLHPNHLTLCKLESPSPYWIL